MSSHAAATTTVTVTRDSSFAVSSMYICTSASALAWCAMMPSRISRSATLAASMATASSETMATSLRTARMAAMEASIATA
jgi:hypothetical protein